MSARVVRGIVLVVCLLSIAGLVTASIADNTEAAVTFGLIGATAVVVLIPVTAVSGRETFGVADQPHPELAARVDHLIDAVVSDGADEAAVRRLVGDAVRIGRDAGWAGSRS